MKTQKDRVRYSLMRYIAQCADYISSYTNVPAASVRRIVAELVEAGQAKVGKDIFGSHGYLAVRARRRAS